jgi:hypothetical protein
MEVEVVVVLLLTQRAALTKRRQLAQERVLTVEETELALVRRAPFMFAQGNLATQLSSALLPAKME